MVTGNLKAKVKSVLPQILRAHNLRTAGMREHPAENVPLVTRDCELGIIFIFFRAQNHRPPVKQCLRVRKRLFFDPYSGSDNRIFESNALPQQNMLVQKTHSIKGDLSVFRIPHAPSRQRRRKYSFHFPFLYLIDAPEPEDSYSDLSGLCIFLHTSDQVILISMQYKRIRTDSHLHAVLLFEAPRKITVHKNDLPALVNRVPDQREFLPQCRVLFHFVRQQQKPVVHKRAVFSVSARGESADFRKEALCAALRHPVRPDSRVREHACFKSVKLLLILIIIGVISSRRTRQAMRDAVHFVRVLVHGLDLPQPCRNMPPVHLQFIILRNQLLNVGLPKLMSFRRIGVIPQNLQNIQI